MVKTTCHFSANSSNAFVWPPEALHTHGAHKFTQADIHIHIPKEKIKNLRKAGRPYSTHRTMRRRQLVLCKQHHLRRNPTPDLREALDSQMAGRAKVKNF